MFILQRTINVKVLQPNGGYKIVLFDFLIEIRFTEMNSLLHFCTSLKNVRTASIFGSVSYRYFHSIVESTLLFPNRSRFLPVKKTSDLLLIMSNLYTLSAGLLVMSPERMFQTTPLVKLGDENFKKGNLAKNASPRITGAFVSLLLSYFSARFCQEVCFYPRHPRIGSLDGVRECQFR